MHCTVPHIDGFSPFPKIMTYFPEEIDDSNLPPHWNVANSLLPSSPTVILDVETGNLIFGLMPTDRHTLV